MFVWLNNTLDRAESELSIYSSLLLSIFFAFILVFVAGVEMNFIGFVVVIVISGLIFILKTSMRGDNLAGSLPPATYPGPPHLGLDGVSLSNYYPTRVRGTG